MGVGVKKKKAVIFCVRDPHLLAEADNTTLLWYQTNCECEHKGQNGQELQGAV